MAILASATTGVYCPTDSSHFVKTLYQNKPNQIVHLIRDEMLASLMQLWEYYNF